MRNLIIVLIWLGAFSSAHSQNSQQVDSSAFDKGKVSFVCTMASGQERFQLKDRFVIFQTSEKAVYQLPYSYQGDKSFQFSIIEGKQQDEYLVTLGEHVALVNHTRLKKGKKVVKSEMHEFTLQDAEERSILDDMTAENTLELPEEENDAVFTFVDEKAEPEGGMASFYKEYIAQHLRFPEGGEEARVMVQFVVTPQGKVKDIQILRSPSEAHSAETVRLLQEGPSWKPAKVRERVVSQRMMIPIRFSDPSKQ